jgi:hypothetical protein
MTPQFDDGPDEPYVIRSCHLGWPHATKGARWLATHGIRPCQSDVNSRWNTGGCCIICAAQLTGENVRHLSDYWYEEGGVQVWEGEE